MNQRRSAGVGAALKEAEEFTVTAVAPRWPRTCLVLISQRIKPTKHVELDCTLPSKREERVGGSEVEQ